MTSPSDSRTSKELLPCPFCGHFIGDEYATCTAELDGKDGVQIGCPLCEAQGPVAVDEDAARYSWNLRAQRASNEPPAELWGDGTREMLIQLRDWLKAKMPCPAGDCCNELRDWIGKVDSHICFHAPAATPPPSPDDARDAARWRALIGCARVRVLGSAGLKDPESKYAHIGVELWTQYPDALMNEAHIETLTAFADRAVLTKGEG